MNPREVEEAAGRLDIGLLCQRAEETAEIAIREKKLGELTAPYAGILLQALVRSLTEATAQHQADAAEIERLGGELATERERVARLEGALPDPDKLSLLADWFDLKDAKAGRTDNEVQGDLRLWARKTRAALAKQEGGDHE